MNTPLIEAAGHVIEVIKQISNGGHPTAFKNLKNILARKKTMPSHKTTENFFNKDIPDIRLKNREYPEHNFLENGQRQHYV